MMAPGKEKDCVGKTKQDNIFNSAALILILLFLQGKMAGELLNCVHRGSQSLYYGNIEMAEIVPWCLSLCADCSRSLEIVGGGGGY